MAANPLSEEKGCNSYNKGQDYYYWIKDRAMTMIERRRYKVKITEDNYVEQMKKKNEKALAFFIDHDGWIVKSLVCAKLEGYAQEQEECMNDVFLAIWENIDKYDKKRAAFTTWVSAVTRYRILNYRRKLYNARWNEDIEQIHIVGEKDVGIDFLQEEEAEFRSLLQGLSEEDQEIFMRLFWEEQDYEEISQEMNLPKQQLYNHISRGKRKLKKSLGKERRFV